MSIENFIDQAGTVAEISTVVATQDVGGGVVETPTLAATEPVRIRQLSGDEVKSLGADRILSTHRMYFKNGVSIAEKDQVTVKDEDGTTIGAFDITFVDDPHKLKRFQQVDATQRK